MDNDQIQAFMDVVAYHSFSAAAKNTYTSQGYLSHKIQLLEQELGVTLLYRGKGIRTVELTDRGAEFMRLVQQYQSTWNDMLSIRERTERSSLSVGAVESINSFTFEPLYIHHLEKHKDIRLSIHTYHSRDLHQRVEARQIDLAYGYNPINHPDILLTPLYPEKLLLVCRADSPYHDGIDPAALPATQEIYIRITPDFERWHNRYWPDNQYKIRVTAGSVLSYLFTDQSCWTITISSVANNLKRLYGLKTYTINSDFPVITCYQMEHKYPRPSRTRSIQTFKQEVLDFIASGSFFCNTVQQNNIQPHE